jgi:hypothetical protein
MTRQLLAFSLVSMCLTACSGGPEAPGAPDGGGPPATVDVHGQVVGPTGVALSGMNVAIGQKTAVTGDDGRFSLAGVTPPYDIEVEPPGTHAFIGRFEGLTRADPTLVFLFLFGNGEPNTATISGEVSGGDPIGTAGVFTTAFFTTTDVRFDLNSHAITSPSDPFTLPVSWFGQESISATVHVLQFTAPRPGDPPTAFTGYGTHSGLALSRDSELTNADVALTAPGNATIQGTILPPDGFQVLEKTLGLEVAGLTALPLGHVDTGDTSFAFTVPQSIPAMAAVTVNAQRDGAGSTSVRLSGIAPGTSNISIPLPLPAQLRSPDDGMTVGTGTPFTWDPPEHAVHLLFVSGGPDQPSIYVVTARSTANLPELPGGVTYHWFVTSVGPFEGIDAFTSGPNFFRALGSDFEAVSATRSFVVR